LIDKFNEFYLFLIKEISNHQLQEMMKVQTAAAVRKIIRKVDTDGDKKISIKEAMTAMQSEIFKA